MAHPVEGAPTHNGAVAVHEGPVLPEQPVGSPVSPPAGFEGVPTSPNGHAAAPTQEAGYLENRGAAALAAHPRIARALLRTIGVAGATGDVVKQGPQYAGAVRRSGGDIAGMAKHGVAAIVPAVKEANYRTLVDEAADTAMARTERARQLRGEYTAQRDAAREADEKGELPDTRGLLGTVVSAVRARSAASKQRKAVDKLAALAHEHEARKAAVAKRTDQVAAHRRSIKARMGAVGRPTDPEA